VLNLNASYRHNEDDWVSRLILDEVVIMPLCRSEEDMQYIYSISNETGVRIFQLLDGKHSIEEIQEIVKKEFQKSEEIDGEVLTFISDLLSVELIEKSSTARSDKDLQARSKDGPSSRKKKAYKTPELVKIRMQPEQAVLSCCLIDAHPKLSGQPQWNYCWANGLTNPCDGPHTGCYNYNNIYGATQAVSS
jgi:Coenzyme PQQ synthesis protein D (PqqD)